MAFVYKITHPKTGKVYIGFTVRPIEHRLKEHSMAKSPHAAIANAIREFGWKSFTFEVVLEGTDEECSNKERELIAEHQSTNPEKGWNGTSGGQTGGLLTDEVKQKMSDAHKGKKFTDEHKRKIGDAVSGEKNGMFGKSAFLGKNHTEETKQVMREAKLGKELTEEHKKNLSESVKEKWKDQEYRERVMSARKNVVLSHDAKERRCASRRGKPTSDTQKTKAAEANQKTWVLTDQNGTTMLVTNLNKFCRENNLPYGSSNFSTRGSYKGWKARLASPEELQ